MTNAKTTEYDLKALLDLSKRDAMLSINCHSIGTIQSFDSSSQTATVSMNYKKVNYGKQGEPPTLTDYPLIIDCPIVILGGGDGVLTFPITTGDSCVILFNDRDIDNWFSSGQVMEPASPRLHSLADAIALVGIRSLKNSVQSYDGTKVALRYGNTKIKLGAKIRLENAATDLLTAMHLLTTALDTFFTATAGAAVEPTLGPAATAAKSAVATFKTTLEGLIE